MSQEPDLLTRRHFLRTSILGAALSWTVPLFVERTFSLLNAEAAETTTQIATGKDHPILLVLQLAGGNDGLNALVPFADDLYYRARPTINIPRDKVLSLDGYVGFNPRMAPLKSLFDQGKLAVIQGSGYPNPNRSHFRSTEIWQTASDSETFEKYGWLGRYFDNACSGCDPTVGVSIGRQMPQAFAAKHPSGVSLDNPQGYRFVSERGPAGAATEESYRKMNEPEPGMSGDAGAAAGSNSGGTI